MCCSRYINKVFDWSSGSRQDPQRWRTRVKRTRRVNRDVMCRGRDCHSLRAVSTLLYKHQHIQAANTLCGLDVKSKITRVKIRGHHPRSAVCGDIDALQWLWHRNASAASHVCITNHFIALWAHIVILFIFIFRQKRIRIDHLYFNARWMFFVY